MSQALIWTIASILGETTTATGLVVIGVIGTAILWNIAMIRWMLARSEIIDVDALNKLKREQGRGRKRSS